MEFIAMSLNSTASFSCDELLEEFEDRLNIITALIYQDKYDEILHQVSLVLQQEILIRQKIPHINSIDWFELIIKKMNSFQSSHADRKLQKNILLDSLFENTPHLARFRRDEKNKHKNNRIVFEEIFSTAVNAFSLEQKVGCLVRLINTLCETNSGRNESVAKTLAQIKSVSKDFECHSFLSISLSWEVITNGIDLLRDYAKNSPEIFELKFPKLEQTILDIEYSLDEIYGFIDLELQTSYFLTKTSFSYKRRYSENSIFNI